LRASPPGELVPISLFLMNNFLFAEMRGEVTARYGVALKIGAVAPSLTEKYVLNEGLGMPIVRVRL